MEEEVTIVIDSDDDDEVEFVPLDLEKDKEEHNVKMKFRISCIEKAIRSYRFDEEVERKLNEHFNELKQKNFSRRSALDFEIRVKKILKAQKKAQSLRVPQSSPRNRRPSHGTVTAVFDYAHGMTSTTVTSTGVATKNNCFPISPPESITEDEILHTTTRIVVHESQQKVINLEMDDRCESPQAPLPPQLSVPIDEDPPPPPPFKSTRDLWCDTKRSSDKNTQRLSNPSPPPFNGFDKPPEQVLDLRPRSPIYTESVQSQTQTSFTLNAFPLQSHSQIPFESGALNGFLCNATTNIGNNGPDNAINNMANMVTSVPLRFLRDPRLKGRTVPPPLRVPNTQVNNNYISPRGPNDCSTYGEYKKLKEKQRLLAEMKVTAQNWALADKQKSTNSKSNSDRTCVPIVQVVDADKSGQGKRKYREIGTMTDNPNQSDGDIQPMLVIPADVARKTSEKCNERADSPVAKIKKKLPPRRMSVHGCGRDLSTVIFSQPKRKRSREKKLAYLDLDHSKQRRRRLKRLFEETSDKCTVSVQNIIAGSRRQQKSQTPIAPQPLTLSPVVKLHRLPLSMYPKSPSSHSQKDSHSPTTHCSPQKQHSPVHRNPQQENHTHSSTPRSSSHKSHKHKVPKVKNIRRDWHSNLKESECLACHKPCKSTSMRHYLQKHGEFYLARLPPDILDQLRRPTSHLSTVIVEWNIKNIKKPERNYNYKCPFCNLRSSLSLANWIAHIGSHTGEPTHQCSKCRFPCRYPKEMHQHLRKCDPNADPISNIDMRRIPLKAYVCHLCDFVQMKKDNLLRHYRKHHDYSKTAASEECTMILLMQQPIDEREYDDDNRQENNSVSNYERALMENRNIKMELLLDSDDEEIPVINAARDESDFELDPELPESVLDEIRIKIESLFETNYEEQSSLIDSHPAGLDPNNIPVKTEPISINSDDDEPNESHNIGGNEQLNNDQTTNNETMRDVENELDSIFKTELDIDSGRATPESDTDTVVNEELPTSPNIKKYPPCYDEIEEIWQEITGSSLSNVTENIVEQPAGFDRESDNDLLETTDDGYSNFNSNSTLKRLDNTAIDSDNTRYQYNTSFINNIQEVTRPEETDRSSGIIENAKYMYDVYDLLTPAAKGVE